MEYAIAYAADLVGITILAYFIYFRRHFRRDLLLSFVALNVGILSVMTILSSVNVTVGLGLGLFSILSIIRLRSDQITQGEIAYYFISLTLGLLAGLHPKTLWIVPAMTVALLVIMYIADHPRLLADTRRHIFTLDNAYIDEATMIDALCILVHGEVRHVEVMEIDLVRDITVVDVRYVVSRRPVTPEPKLNGSSEPKLNGSSAPKLNGNSAVRVPMGRRAPSGRRVAR